MYGGSSTLTGMFMRTSTRMRAKSGPASSSMMSQGQPWEVMISLRSGSMWIQEWPVSPLSSK